MPITCRAAILKDLPTLLTFEQGIIQAERPYDATLKPDPISYYDLGELIQSEQAEVAVATDGELLIGSGYVLIKEGMPYRTFTHFAFLGFMYVRPEYRGQGVNQLVVEHLRQWSLARGITEARLDVYAGNAAAIRAYEKAGFEASLVDMRMDWS